MDKIELPYCSGRYIFDSYLREFCTQLLLILNIFPFRLRKTVSTATTTPPKHTAAFAQKPGFILSFFFSSSHHSREWNFFHILFSN